MTSNDRLLNRGRSGAKAAPDRLTPLSPDQRRQICRTLLFLGGEGANPRGKTPAPASESAGLSCSPDLSILRRIAKMMLRPGGGVTLMDLLRLSPDPLSAVSRLLDTLALGPDAVEWWLDDYAPRG